MKFDKENHGWDLSSSGPERGRYKDRRTGDVVLAVGDHVMVTKPAVWNGRRRPQFEVGKIYRVAAVYSDWVVSLAEKPGDRNIFNSDFYVDIDCVETVDPVTDEELATVMRSLGVQP